MAKSSMNGVYRALLPVGAFIQIYAAGVGNVCLVVYNSAKTKVVSHALDSYRS
jgi:hypothetical protein